MLTEAEKMWLEERKPPTKKPYKTTADDNFCRHCTRYNTNCIPWFRDVAYCPTDQGGDFRDAAEFSARVAAKLAEETAKWEPCYNSGRCPVDVLYAKKCIPCRLKHARLEVEAEMEQ